MELFRLLGTIAIENGKANDAIDDTTGKAEKSESKISAAFKKIGSVVVTAFAVDKIVNFGKACVENAASVKAMNSQFEQTFAGVEEQAAKAMQNVAETSNILQTRLQGVGTSIFAFAKTTGMETPEALGLMERALQVTADSAAYYDRSLEETSESLKSFLKGNYENDAALGLSCTEVTRNTAANELFGKSFKDLSESQKQLTLLKMVEDANALSGAMGQAAREGEGWENVMGNLKESWKQFTAIIGAPILTAIIPAIQGVTSGISFLGEKMEGFIDDMSDGDKRAGMFKKALDSMFSQEFQSDIEWYATTAFPNLLSNLKDNSVAAFSGQFEKLQDVFTKLKGVLQPFVELVLGRFVDNLGRISSIAGDIVVPVIGFLSDAFLTISGVVLDSVKPALDNILEAFESLGQIVDEAILDIIVPACESFLEMIKDLWEENQDKVTKIGELFAAVFGAISSVVQWFIGIVETYLYPVFIYLVTLVQDNMGQIQAVFQSVFDIIGGIIDFFIALFTGNWQGMWDAIGSILEAGSEFIQNIFNLVKEFLISIGTKIWSVVTNAFEDVRQSIINKLNAAKETVVSVWTNIKDTIKEKAEEALEWVKEKFEAIKENISEKIENAKKIVTDKFEEIKNKIKEKVEAALGQVQEKFESIKSSISEKIEDAKKIATDKFEEIKSNIKDKVESAKEDVKQKFEDIKSGIKEKLESAKETVTGIFDDIKESISDKISSAKDTVQDMIERIKGFFNFEWSLPKLKMPHFNVSGKFSLNPPSVPTFDIEWYKKGGVMEDPTIFGYNPATNKVMAGGEAGAEAIAPIDVLQKYVSEAVSGRNSELVHVLELILDAVKKSDEGLEDKLYKALQSVTFDINKREFARLVKAVN